ncbi:STAS domain-containing protein [Paenibacillus macquariensis]|uniref:Anti-sigma factor antagonist n=1 Tax=Paenibacillus macquariensis TaxID=948756 RepID=A0ABY1K8H4_9BACL|nr:STAS domain-containing protein [Paenibacillus macquariensis]MEC0093258.1 STAS domain-containing protein [Paenibacillus macquariensis]OAB27575.1 anti-sigma F factor antagonist [Paenibacillus macquariensis subsp. macquariensis]SIR40859.1 anti-sigma B factor antagonist [Paenibacillus macquariensis]
MNTNKNEKFNATTESTDGTITVVLSGELDLSVAPEFRLMMKPIVEDSNHDLIINLKNLKYIDSTGIGILLSILKARHGMGSQFLVEDVPSQIQKLFDMTGISKFFATKENS